MNLKSFLPAAALIAASTLAYASSPEYTRLDSNADSPKTRAQVQQELRQAQAQGLTDVREDEYPIIQQTEAHKTRAQVVAELRQAQAQGLTNQTDDVYPIILKNGSARTRAEVRAEAVQEARNEHSRRNSESLYFGG